MTKREKQKQYEDFCRKEDIKSKIKITAYILAILLFMALAVIFLDKAETPPQEPKLLLYDDQLMMFYPI